jgi:hypothetical protein
MGNISIDLFGTLDKYGQFWQELTKWAILEGHKIYVLSGLWPNDINRRLEGLGYKRDIHYTGMLSIIQKLKEFGFDYWFDENHDSWYSDNMAWWAAKAEICKDHSIHIHFDNDKKFEPYFGDVATRFIHTESDAGERLLKAWHRDLKLSNTYEDWEEDYYWNMMAMGRVPSAPGVVPM